MIVTIGIGLSEGSSLKTVAKPTGRLGLTRGPAGADQ
jgi:hypothetical protein